MCGGGGGSACVCIHNARLRRVSIGIRSTQQSVVPVPVLYTV